MTRRSFLAAASVTPLFAQPARFSYGSAPQQFGEMYLPHGPAPHTVVLFCHGGFWRNSVTLGLARPICSALAAAGAAVWNLEYRRLGDPGASWSNISDDVVRGAQHLVSLQARYSLDLSRTVVAGHSAGGHLALWLAAQRVIDLRGVTGLAAISDLRRAWSLQLDGGVVRELLGGTPNQIPQRYAAASPVEMLPISVQQRMLHGAMDKVVPFDMSQRFAKASGNSKLIPLANAGHSDLIDPHSAVWPEVQRAILDWQF